jgi:hypothetical protein
MGIYRYRGVEMSRPSVGDREAFERWAFEKFDVKRSKVSPAHYRDDLTQQAWVGWQACSAQIPSTPRPSMQFTLGQAETLLSFFGGSNADMTVEYFPLGHWPDIPDARAGLYVYCTEYPDEGAQWLGAEDNSEDIKPTWIPANRPATDGEAVAQGDVAKCLGYPACSHAICKCDPQNNLDAKAYSVAASVMGTCPEGPTDEALRRAIHSYLAAQPRAVPDAIETAPFYWTHGGGVKQDTDTAYCVGWNDCRSAILAAQQPTVEPRVVGESK